MVKRTAISAKENPGSELAEKLEQFYDEMHLLKQACSGNDQMKWHATFVEQKAPTPT